MVPVESLSFAELLRRYRIAAGYSQEELAERAGLSVQAISALERGVRRAPRPETVRRMGEALGLTVVQARVLEEAVRRRRGPRDATPTLPEGLPVPRTMLVGREHDEAVLEYLLSQGDSSSGTRLLTLLGPGGVGKTRLAAQVAMRVARHYAHGLAWVDLSPLHDAALVPAAIARRVGARESAILSAHELAREALRERELLLVLDNFEQVLDARGVIVDLLAGCPRVRVLVTSRAPLRLRGEREYVVTPLAVPEAGHDGERTAAMDLFEQRAWAVKPELRLSGEALSVVGQICRRLDGLPLAIELAAALVGVLPPRAMLTRLSAATGALDVLAEGAWELPDRQQTMRATISWSHDLLAPDERALFRRLAVFVGGAEATDVEAVCLLEGDPPDFVARGLRALREKSLLRMEERGDGAARVAMLETIREYALERLEESSEAPALREGHAACYLGLAERAEEELTAPTQGNWMAQLERDLDNLRAALEWAEQGGESRPQRIELGLRIAGALRRFWERHGRTGEGRVWLERLLVLAPSGHTPVRAKALRAAGTLAYRQGDYERATAWYELSLDAYRELHDRAALCGLLSNLGNVALDQGAYERAVSLYDDSLTVAREVGDAWHIASVLNNLGEATRHQGHAEQSATYYEESLALYRRVGDTWSIASVLNNMGELACSQGDYTRATALSREALRLDRQLGDRQSIPRVLANLGAVAYYQGDLGRAKSLYAESLAAFESLNDRTGVARCLEASARLAQGAGQPERAAQLLGAAQALRTAIGAPMPLTEHAAYEAVVAEARAALAAETFAAVWASGESLTLEQAIAAAKG